MKTSSLYALKEPHFNLLLTAAAFPGADPKEKQVKSAARVVSLSGGTGIKERRQQRSTSQKTVYGFRGFPVQKNKYATKDKNPLSNNREYLYISLLFYFRTVFPFLEPFFIIFQPQWDIFLCGLKVQFAYFSVKSNWKTGKLSLRQIGERERMAANA